MAVLTPRGPRPPVRRAHHEVAPPMVAENGDRAGILAGNQPRWHMADVGIMAAGAVTVPASPTGAGGELTPTLKVKRTVVIERFREIVEEMYAR